MKLTLVTTLLMLGLAWSAPVLDEDETLNITPEFYPKELAVYEGQHDIVNIVVPLNSLNFDEEESSESNSKESDSEIIVFFAEADIDAAGKRDYKGLYTLKEGKATKILENGVDAASSGDSSKTVYLAATDGIYIYSPEHETPVKYGSISDSVIGIAHEAESEVFYILTEDHSVYKVIDNGNNKEKLEDVVDAQQIVLDYSNNLYFYTSDKKVYAKSPEGVKEVVGLPENPTRYTLVKPPIVFDSGVMWIADEQVYLIQANGTADNGRITFERNALPTGFGPEAALIQYYGYNKKIYEYNILALFLGTLLEELKTFLNDKTDEIQTLATQKRQSLRKKA